MNRYLRQQILPQVGADGQARLADASILVIGAGGLGCPALQYLCGAGVGTLIVVDPDVVEQSNLHRQPLFGENWLGQPKAIAAQAVLQNLNPQVTVQPHVMKLDPVNAISLIEQADIVLDCADSFAASYTLSDICQLHSKPLISASALGLSGYIGGFCASAPSLRAVFPDLPRNSATCATAGVMGPVVGTIGSLQAQMALNVLLGFSPSPLGQMITINFSNFAFGGFRFDQAPEPQQLPFAFISDKQLSTKDLIIELREEDEAPRAAHPEAVRALVSTFEQQQITPKPGQRTVMCCRSGLRSWRAAAALREYWDGTIVLIAMGDEVTADTIPNATPDTTAEALV
ncbi:HesA/MoeB/ThiF family protein [Paraglaciecola sp.]|uniref:HesA/MoeB/ThiF family protein n=1 Tax=Paraglaciecola sp. TaxID=1920173 RepID=UPI0030F3DC5D